jgi:hypothetical protein
MMKKMIPLLLLVASGVSAGTVEVKDAIAKATYKVLPDGVFQVTLVGRLSHQDFLEAMPSLFTGMQSMKCSTVAMEDQLGFKVSIVDLAGHRYDTGLDACETSGKS